MLPQEIKDVLKQLSTVYKENSKNIIIRCPYCGDSINPRHAHLYISKTDPPYPFHCFRAECEAKGTVKQLLSDFDLLDKISKQTLIDLYKNGSSVRKYRLNTNTFKPKTVVQKTDLESYEIKKLEYLKSRLSIDTIPDWLAKFIVTDFSDILKQNITINKVVRENLQENYIGFSTFKSSKIICRRIRDLSYLPRYYMINIELTNDYFMSFPFPEDTHFYGSNGSVIIGEGVFDVLGGFNHLRNILDLKRNTVLIASSGKAYYNAYSFIVSRLGVVDWNFYILADNDVSNKHLKKMFKGVKTNLNIVRNTIGKDMGELVTDVSIVKL